MSFHGVLAQSTVTDLTAAESWYTTLFGRGPDTRPMGGLIEWYLDEHMGVQVWAESERAGHSSLVLMATDLDAQAVRLQAAGLTDAGPEPITGARVVPLADPDGNRVVLVGS